MCTPIALDGIIAKCLAKDPDMRYQHVDEIPADLKAAQENTKNISRVVTPQEIPMPEVKEKRFLRPGWKVQLFSATVLVLLSVLVTYLLAVDSVDSKGPSYRFELTMTGNSLESAIAISPDGKSCAYTGVDQNGKNHLYLSRFDQFERYSIISAMLKIICEVFESCMISPLRKHCSLSD